MADAAVSKTAGATHVGSTPTSGTILPRYPYSVSQQVYPTTSPQASGNVSARSGKRRARHLDATKHALIQYVLSVNPFPESISYIGAGCHLRGTAKGFKYGRDKLPPLVACMV